MSVAGSDRLERPRLYIFDADGTLRRTTIAGRPCPRAPDEWELIPGVRERLARIDWHGVRIGVASNQDQVGYGHVSEAMARTLLGDMLRAAFGRTVSEARIELCPHVLGIDCACRKPAPGMLLTIMRHFDIAPAATLYVGDAEVDREAARRAGVHFAWAQEFLARGADSTVPPLEARAILARSGRTREPE